MDESTTQLNQRPALFLYLTNISTKRNVREDVELQNVRFLAQIGQDIIC